MIVCKDCGQRITDAGYITLVDGHYHDVCPTASRRPKAFEIED